MCRDQAWPSVEYAIISRNVAIDALNSLVAEVVPLSNRLELYAKGLVSYGGRMVSLILQDIIPKEGGVDVSHIQECLTTLSSIVRLSAEERGRLAENEGRSITAVMSGMVAMALMAMDGNNGIRVQQQGE